MHAIAPQATTHDGTLSATPTAITQAAPPNILAAASIVLCAAVVMLWVRSFNVTDNLWWSEGADVWGLTTGRGQVRISIETYGNPSDQAHFAGMHHEPLSPYDFGDDRNWTAGGADLFGFRAGVQSAPNGGWWYAIIVPFWFVILLFLVAPAGWFVSRYRIALVPRYRNTNAQCLNCGYNLTGNISGVCPECGMAVPARSISNAS